MKDYGTQSVGSIVAEQPLRAAVFDQFGIDFCCGGKESLASACRKVNIDQSKVIALLEESDARAGGSNSSKSLLSVGLKELVDHIEQVHHQYLKRELPRLQELANKVARVHGAKDARLTRLASLFAATSQEIAEHLNKEEMILFPYIRTLDQHANLVTRPQFATVANPIRCMESEHESTADALMQLRELTDTYTPPNGACTSWVALLSGLSHLDRDLRIHVHKENSILFPKALSAEQAQSRSTQGC